MDQSGSRRTNLQVALDFGDSACLLPVARQVAAHADWIEVLFPWAYWLALVSDSLFGRPDCGAFLAVRLRKKSRGQDVCPAV